MSSDHFLSREGSKTIYDHYLMHFSANLITSVGLGHWETVFVRKYCLICGEFWLHSERKNIFWSINPPEIESTRTVDVPRYSVYCVDPSELRDLIRSEKNFFSGKKVFLRGVTDFDL